MPLLRRLALAAALVASVALPAAAYASPAAATLPAAAKDVTAGTGYDISNYQCGDTLPASPQFVVIEMEGAPFHHTTSAACLQQQYAYAAAAPVPPQYYVYASDTANRGGDTTITTVCGKSPTADCAHGFGESAAEDAVQYADTAGLPVTPTTWWVDVECASSTCPDWSSSTAVNQAAIKGYVDGLETRPDRVKGVGFYSTSYQWGKITGQSNGAPAFGVEGLPVWYPDYDDALADGAAKYCGTLSFNGGAVAMVQGAATDVDPDAGCQPTIATVTQGALAGGLVTATGVAAPASNVTLLISDSFTPQHALGVVTTDATGHWSQAFHLGSNGVLTAQASDGSQMSVPIGVVAKVNVSKVRGDGRDKLGHCIDRVDGSTYPYVPGSMVALRGARDKMVGFGYVKKLGTIGSWMATVVVTCDKAGQTTKATMSGVLPGSKVLRFAADGRTAAIKLPVNKTPPKAKKR